MTHNNITHNTTLFPFTSRTRMLIGDEAVSRLADSSVAVFGVGGVGSYVVEALARSGIGRLILVDADTVAMSNINRQIVATHKTIGKLKAEVAAERVSEINPDIKAEAYPVFYDRETVSDFDFTQMKIDYIADAIDTVTSKLLLIEEAKKHNVPIISSMGTGNKLDPTRFRVSDISKTSVCPLARVMRRELKARGIEKLKVVWSDEIPRTPIELDENDAKQTGRRSTPASIAFVPSAAGLIIASEIVMDITNNTGDRMSPP